MLLEVVRDAWFDKMDWRRPVVAAGLRATRAWRSGVRASSASVPPGETMSSTRTPVRGVGWSGEVFWTPVSRIGEVCWGSETFMRGGELGGVSETARDGEVPGEGGWGSDLI